jgi:hypothetical protein
MLTGIEATIQESEPLMIQPASVNCADQMQSTGFTLVLSESMSTADSEEPGSVTHDRREPSEEPASLSHDRREPNPQGINAIIPPQTKFRDVYRSELVGRFVLSVHPLIQVVFI